jgi:RNA polymerase sigma-70 factor (ECF subfamily)
MVRDHLDAVWRLLHRLGVRDGDVDDAVQRVFLTTSRKLREVEPGKERAFLMAVANREASHVRRSYRRRAEIGQEAIGDKSTGRPRPDDLAGNKRALEYVSAAIDQLDEELRVVFVLFEVEEMSSDQIGDVLGIPTGTVKSRLRRARARFAALTLDLRQPGPGSVPNDTASRARSEV